MELSMEAYIDKLGADLKRASAPRRFRPLDPKALRLTLRSKDDVAPTQLTTRYQSLIGKLLYCNGSWKLSETAFLVEAGLTGVYVPGRV
jgi:hypothetical protein